MIPQRVGLLNYIILFKTRNRVSRIPWVVANLRLGLPWLPSYSCRWWLSGTGDVMRCGGRGPLEIPLRPVMGESLWITILQIPPDLLCRKSWGWGPLGPMGMVTHSFYFLVTHIFPPVSSQLEIPHWKFDELKPAVTAAALGDPAHRIIWYKLVYVRCNMIWYQYYDTVWYYYNITCVYCIHTHTYVYYTYDYNVWYHPCILSTALHHPFFRTMTVEHRPNKNRTKKATDRNTVTWCMS